MKIRRRWRWAAVIGLASVALGIGTIQVRHHARHGHWIGYGWHVDVVSESADYGIPGIKHVQYAEVTNFTVLPGAVESSYVPTDVEPFKAPAFAFRIQKLDRTTGSWKTWSPFLRMECDSSRVVRNTIWPLMSFSTEPGAWAAIDGNRRRDWIRIIVLSAFDGRPGARKEFVSPPFQLTEERQPVLEDRKQWF